MATIALAEIEYVSSQLQNWVDDPVTRISLPRAPQLVEPLRSGLDQKTILEERLTQNLELTRLLLNSGDPDLNLAAVFLFDPVIAADGKEQLERICNESEDGRKLWEAFLLAATLYSQYKQSMAQISPEGVSGALSSQQQRGTLLTVIVHGTAAAGYDWWREKPGEKNFWHYINSITGDCVRHGNEFIWSGGVTDSDRRQGARVFLNWWQSQRRPRLRVIAHSHGANVVWYAAVLEPALKIETLISLGAPICIDYPLRLGQIQSIKNVYSEHDSWQTRGANITGARGEGRTLPDSAQVTNYHVPQRNPNLWGHKLVRHPHLHEEEVWANNKLGTLL